MPSRMFNRSGARHSAINRLSSGCVSSPACEIRATSAPGTTTVSQIIQELIGEVASSNEWCSDRVPPVSSHGIDPGRKPGERTARAGGEDRRVFL